MLNIEYKAETEEDMTDLMQSMLMVRSIAFMAKRFVETLNELPEGYYELQEAFDAILMLIEPAMTHFNNEIELKPPKKQRIRKSA